MDPVLAVSVERNAEGDYVLAWDARFCAGEVTVSGAGHDRDFDRGGALAVSTSGGASVSVPGDPGRAYFRLQPNAGPSLVVAERALPFVGGVNFRDIGGYAIADGRRLKWGVLFRSGHMANLSTADKRLFAALDIGTVIDFRMLEEREHEKTELPGPPELHVIGIPPGIGDRYFFHRLFAASDDPADVVDAMHQMMACLVRDAAPYYARMFEVLLGAPRGAVLMNCSAGKERTGVAIALLLAALGVPRETIMYDFMLSASCFPALAEVPRVLEKYAVESRGEAATALIMPLLETRRSYLDAAFAAIEADCGSVAAFLHKHYGLKEAELTRLRALYTA